MDKIKIVYGSVFGNFRWDAEAEITQEQAVLLAPLGALQIAQRTPSTEAEKKMASYEKRPKGFKRTDIPYTEDGAEVLRKAHSSLAIGEGDEVPATVTVSLYEGSGTEPKYKEEKEILARHVAAKDVAEWAQDKVGFAGTGLTEENAEFLQAIKAYKQAMLKEV